MLDRPHPPCYTEDPHEVIRSMYQTLVRHPQFKAQYGAAVGLLVLAMLSLALAYQSRRPVTLEMSSASEQAYLARGFYRPEEAFGVTYRWTDGNAQIHLPGLGSGASLRLRVNLHEFRPPPLAPDPVTISINGRRAARFTPGVELAAYDFDLPAGLIDWRGDATIGLKSDTFIPQQALASGSTDERSLGLFVDRVQFEYGPGLIIPPLIVWVLLAITIVLAFGFCQVVHPNVRLGLGASLALLAGEVIGVVMARPWIAHNSPWIALTAFSLYLIALRLKSSRRPARGEQPPAAGLPESAAHDVQPAAGPPQKREIPRRETLSILALFVVWRIVLMMIPVVGADVEAVGECCPQVDPTPLTSVWQAAFERWYRWDALWYGSIAQNGYQYAGAREASNVAFFPFFPLVNGLVSRLSGLPVAASGPLVSTLLALGACMLLYRLMRQETDDADAATRTATYLLAFPGAFYLTIGYAEALYLLCSLTAIYCARHGRWALSGGAAFLAGLTRLHGVLLIVPLAYEYGRQREFSLRNVRADLVGVLGAPLGVLTFMGYLGLRFNQPMAYFQVQGLFFNRKMAPGAFPAFPGATLVNYLQGFVNNPPSTEGVIEIGVLILFLILTLEAWIRLPRVYGVYMLTLALFTLSSGDLNGMPRYITPVFPIFMTLGLMTKRPWAERAILIGSLSVQAILALMFTNGYWIA